MWDEAWNDFKSEQTPAQFNVQSLEPNIINLARYENWGKGLSSRFFYNEVPKPTWLRHGGRLENPDKHLYSFTHGNLGSEDLFGFDTSTPEGQKRLIDEIKYWKRVTPQTFENIPDDIDALELSNDPPTEPHFQRTWNHYRRFQFNLRLNHLVESGDLEKSDVEKARQYFDADGMPSPTMIANAQRGVYGDLTDDPAWTAFEKVSKWLGLNLIEFDTSTAEPVDEQYWGQFDQVFELREEEMIKYLPVFVTDPRDHARIEAMQGEDGLQPPREVTKKLG